MGKNNAPNQDKYLGVGKAVKNLLKASVSQNKGYNVYFDNCFTSYDLLQYFSDEEMCVLHRVRENQKRIAHFLKKYSLQK